MREDLEEAIEAALTVNMRTDGRRERQLDALTMRFYLLEVLRNIDESMSVRELREELGG